MLWMLDTKRYCINAAGLVACLAMAAGVAGCRIHVDKGANGEDKNVQVDTPFGGIHVNTDQTTAEDLGLPVYPGAADRERQGERQIGGHPHGLWRVGAAREGGQLLDARQPGQGRCFYKKALGRYGDVIACQDNAPVGKPTQTSEGPDLLRQQRRPRAGQRSTATTTATTRATMASN